MWNVILLYMEQITDDIIIQEFVDFSRNRLYEVKLNSRFMSNHPEYDQYLRNRYQDPFTKYSEVISRIFHHIDVIPTCHFCGKPLPFRSFKTPYRTWCNQQCQLRDKEFIRKRTEKIDYSAMVKHCKESKRLLYGDENYNGREKAKQTCLERYGVETYLGSKLCLDQTKKTCLEKYGVENASQSPEVIDKIKHTKQKRYGDPKYTNREQIKRTCLERYGHENYMLCDEFRTKSKDTRVERYGDPNYTNREQMKQTCLERYGVSNPMQDPSVAEKMGHTLASERCQQQIYETKKQNHTFSTSKIEEQFKEWLDQNNIEYIYQYKSSDYPFVCDFYFPQSNLYFEIQGTWTHGKHPYDEKNSDDVRLATKWREKHTKFYDIAYNVWVNTDVKKRNWAKEHNLNWVEVFSIKLDDVIKAYNDYV